MSIRHGLLALLHRQPMYGYQLRSEFEATTGSTWPLNVGQVYTTLGRLERDGCVSANAGSPAHGGGGGSEDPQGEELQKTYAITDLGRTELTLWFATPVSRARRPRDELAIKLAMALVAPAVDVAAVVQFQRTDTLRALQDYTRLKTKAEDGELSWLLVLDSLIFAAEAEVRWLDHCEARLARHRPTRVGMVVPPVTTTQNLPKPVPS
ncbi:MAG: PadR family transcriptional regulator [Geodermatophilaceae bacterium]|nr:PadR family transcriptional regulator [Geodermatophilaceae bacterium]